MTPPSPPQIRSQIADSSPECRDKSYSHLSLEIKTDLVKIYSMYMTPPSPPQTRPPKRPNNGQSLLRLFSLLPSPLPHVFPNFDFYTILRLPLSSPSLLTTP